MTTPDQFRALLTSAGGRRVEFKTALRGFHFDPGEGQAARSTLDALAAIGSPRPDNEAKGIKGMTASNDISITYMLLELTSPPQPAKQISVSPGDSRTALPSEARGPWVRTQERLTPMPALNSGSRELEVAA